MRVDIVTKRIAPEPPYTCEMIDIDTEGIPFMLGALWLRSQQYWWLGPDNQRVGRSLMNEESVRLLMPCSRQITNLLEALYNLQDATVRGELRDVTGAGTDEDPYVYDPPIPQAVDPIVYQTPGLQYFSQQSFLGIQNITDGAPSTNFPDTRNIRQQLEDIYNKLSESDTDLTDIENLLNLIQLALV